MSDSIRAISGATLAAEIVQALNTTVTGGGKTKLNIQFGAYASFQSFFGLANLTSTSNDFYGIPDYASTMTFELFTSADPSPFPAPEDIRVRYLFHNGTTSNDSQPTTFPLFGQSEIDLSWTDFVAGMNKFAVGDQSHWCQVCGNSTGVCAPSAGSTSPPPQQQSDSNSGGSGVSKAVAGVIGAMVTLAVILAVEVAVLLIGGLRLVSKKRLAGGGVVNGEGNGSATKA